MMIQQFYTLIEYPKKTSQRDRLISTSCTVLLSHMGFTIFPVSQTPLTKASWISTQTFDYISGNGGKLLNIQQEHMKAHSILEPSLD